MDNYPYLLASYCRTHLLNQQASPKPTHLHICDIHPVSTGSGNVSRRLEIVCRNKF